MPVIRSGERSVNSAINRFRLRPASNLRGVTTAPVFVAQGTAVGGSSTASPSWPAQAAKGDLGIAISECSGGQTLVPPSSWTELAGSPLITVADATGSKIQAFYKFAEDNQPAQEAFTISGGDHMTVQIFAFSGVKNDIAPSLVGTFTNSTAVTSHTWPSATLPDSNCRLLLFVGDEVDSGGTAYTDALSASGNLTSVGNHTESRSSVGDGGGFAIWQALCTSGTTGTVTATSGTSRISAGGIIVLRPSQALLP